MNSPEQEVSVRFRGSPDQIADFMRYVKGWGLFDSGLVHIDVADIMEEQYVARQDMVEFAELAGYPKKSIGKILNSLRRYASTVVATDEGAPPVEYRDAELFIRRSLLQDAIKDYSRVPNFGEKGAELLRNFFAYQQAREDSESESDAS